MRPDKTPQTFPQAVKNAFAGVRYGLKNERNVQIDAVFAVLALVLGLLFRISLIEWLAICVCIGMVLGLELVNTALESVVDLACIDYHVLAGRAKDCAAGACLVVSICAFVVGAIIFLPRIAALLCAL